MSDKKHGRGGNNPHLRTSQKKLCSKCGQLANHYSDRTIEAHKVYQYTEIKGVKKKTSKWHYCENRTWS